MRACCLLAIVSCAAVVACGGSSSPTGPSNERVAGAWIGNATLTSVTGGECVGAMLQGAQERRDIFSARIEQRDADLAASITFQGNHTSCVYNGRVQGSSISLDMTSCQAGRIETVVRCANGATREVAVASSRLTAQVGGNTGTGSETTTWNVYPAGGSTPLAVLTTTSQFRWNLLGLPHTDFHIFDGSILPGYVDGVTIIPEEPNPFCLTCGWFW